MNITEGLSLIHILDPPLTMTLLDEDFSSYTFPDGAAYSWLWDTLYGSGLPPVDLSTSDTITFEFYVSDYATFTERISGGKGASDIRFTLGSDSGNRTNSRASVSFLDQITKSCLLYTSCPTCRQVPLTYWSLSHFSDRSVRAIPPLQARGHSIFS